MFAVGSTYTRDEIHAALGGSKRACIPTLNGMVLSVCVTPELNPRAPREILCGVGPVMAKTGEMLARASNRVPVFVKRRVNTWEYMGAYQPVASYRSGLHFDAMVAGSGRTRSDVSIAVELHP